MKVLVILVMFTFVFNIHAQEKSKRPKSTKALIAQIFQKFSNGKYQEVIDTLADVEKRLKKGSTRYNEILGLIQYWRGMSYSRLNDYEFAEKYLKEAIDLNYKSKDLYYEYGQALYVSDKYKKARVAFKRSFKKGYKIGVSLYYIAFISQELNDHKKAVRFYSMIEKLPEEERKDVIQAARMQIGDIYLKKIEKLPDSFKDVEKYVIPQYQKALAFDKESSLADQIKKKIEDLQRKYELVLFRMRNGRPTNRPPYYLRANVLYGINDNVTTLSEDSKESSSTEDYESHYYTTGAYGRYSFYPSSSISYAPEFNVNTTRYSSPSSTIYALNKYAINTALKINYEHMYKKSPATFFLDLSYSYNADGADAATEEEQKLAYAFTTTSITLSEELQIWTGNSSVFRYKFANTTDDDTTQNFTNSVFNYEQIVGLGRTTLFFFTSFDMKRFAETDQESGNTNTLTLRLDAIFPTFYGLFNPTLYASSTQTNYIEDSDTGITNLITYGINMNRPLSRKFFATMDLSQGSQTADVDSSVYTQQVMTFNIDYIY